MQTKIQESKQTHDYYVIPQDFTIEFSYKEKKTIVHIPFDDLPKVAELLNSFLQSNGIKSHITEM